MTDLVCKKRNDDGKLCPNVAVTGDDKCKSHGGKPNKKLTKKRQNYVNHYVGNGPIKNIEVVRRMNGTFGSLGDPVDIDPAEALLEEIRRSYGHVLWLRRKCESLEEEDLVTGTKVEIDEDSYGDDGRNYKLSRTEKRAEISKWWELYEKERRHLASISAAAVKANIEQAKIDLEERKINALETAIVASLIDLGVDPHTTKARTVIGNRLREALSGTPVVIEGELAAAAIEVSAADTAGFWGEPEAEDW